MSAGKWMDDLWVQIDDCYSGKFIGQFEDADRAKETWKRAIVRKLPLDDKQRAAKALRKAVDMVPHECPYPPVLADLLGLLDTALAETRREAAMDQRYPAIGKTSDNPLLNVLGYLEKHSGKSAVAQEELGKMRDYLRGESLEQATGMTFAQHKTRLEDYGRIISERNRNEILLRQRLYGDSNG